MQGQATVLAIFIASFLTCRMVAADEPASDGRCAPGWEKLVFSTSKGSVVRIRDGGA